MADPINGNKPNNNTLELGAGLGARLGLAGTDQNEEPVAVNPELGLVPKLSVRVYPFGNTEHGLYGDVFLAPFGSRSTDVRSYTPETFDRPLTPEESRQINHIDQTEATANTPFNFGNIGVGLGYTWRPSNPLNFRLLAGAAFEHLNRSGYIPVEGYAGSQPVKNSFFIGPKIGAEIYPLHAGDFLFGAGLSLQVGPLITRFDSPNAPEPADSVGGWEGKLGVELLALYSPEPTPPNYEQTIVLRCEGNDDNQNGIPGGCDNILSEPVIDPVTGKVVPIPLPEGATRTDPYDSARLIRMDRRTRSISVFESNKAVETLPKETSYLEPLKADTPILVADSAEPVLARAPLSAVATPEALNALPILADNAGAEVPAPKRIYDEKLVEQATKTYYKPAVCGPCDPAEMAAETAALKDTLDDLKKTYFDSNGLLKPEVRALLAHAVPEHLLDHLELIIGPSSTGKPNEVKNQILIYIRPTPGAFGAVLKDKNGRPYEMRELLQAGKRNQDLTLVSRALELMQEQIQEVAGKFVVGKPNPAKINKDDPAQFYTTVQNFTDLNKFKVWLKEKGIFRKNDVDSVEANLKVIIAEMEKGEFSRKNLDLTGTASTEGTIAFNLILGTSRNAIIEKFFRLLGFERLGKIQATGEDVASLPNPLDIADDLPDGKVLIAQKTDAGKKLANRVYLALRDIVLLQNEDKALPTLREHLTQKGIKGLTEDQITHLESQLKYVQSLPPDRRRAIALPASLEDARKMNRTVVLNLSDAPGAGDTPQPIPASASSQKPWDFNTEVVLYDESIAKDDRSKIPCDEIVLTSRALNADRQTPAKAQADVVVDPQSCNSNPQIDETKVVKTNIRNAFDAEVEQAETAATSLNSRYVELLAPLTAELSNKNLTTVDTLKDSSFKLLEIRKQLDSELSRVALLAKQIPAGHPRHSETLERIKTVENELKTLSATSARTTQALTAKVKEINGKPQPFQLVNVAISGVTKDQKGFKGKVILTYVGKIGSKLPISVKGRPALKPNFAAQPQELSFSFEGLKPGRNNAPAKRTYAIVDSKNRPVDTVELTVTGEIVQVRLKNKPKSGGSTEAMPPVPLQLEVRTEAAPAPKATPTPSATPADDPNRVPSPEGRPGW